MTKQEFLTRFQDGLKGLPEQEVQERIEFYSEMIDDLLEEGLSEDEAVAKIGTVEETVSKNVVDNHFEKNSNIKHERKLKIWEVVLLVVGSPVWASLLVTAVVVVVALYVSLWAVIVSIWVVFGASVGCVLAGAVSGIVSIFGGNALIGLATFGAGILCAGFSIFAFFGSLAVTKYTVLGTKICVLWVKNHLSKKECAK